MPASIADPAADDSVSDEGLMQRYAAGEAAAFEPLYRRHKDGLWRYFLRQGCDQASAAELFQEVWSTLIRTRTSYRPSARFATWLYRLAHSRLVDHWRLRRPQDALDEDDERLADSEHRSPPARAGQAEQAQRLLTALAGLSPEQRQAFLLQAEAGLSLEEIATEQGVGRETVKSRLRYALAKLRKELADVWP
ncbi:sigma-70 family RNA polymerase sigma factor [Stagnimonas aquatica]|uniref:Sigma-70 family RNA polymerase sigma factor n=1 Tax=Stagnimonas aquatica TaxID=2689987 RepID=A0A3N0VAN6_9GAMM|nr:sigma-70 family RNA polymerase sigma factor [Stagnimonas aquatica]ROH89722.1 sigma-70 family RNA polymerase sigma factor [Stagnimonas aquatica]